MTTLRIFPSKEAAILAMLEYFRTIYYRKEYYLLHMMSLCFGRKDILKILSLVYKYAISNDNRRVELAGNILLGKVPEELKQMLENIPLPSESICKDLENARKIFENKEEDIKREISKIFLFKAFPKEIWIAPIEVYSAYHHHTYISPSDPPIIILSVSQGCEPGYIVDSLLHELLHYLFYKHGIRELFEKYNIIRFEEAIIRFFCPSGHLSLRLGLEREQAVLAKFNKIRRGYSREDIYALMKNLEFLIDYDFSVSVWEYILQNSKDPTLKEVMMEVVKKLESAY